jgi:putative resolvase
MNEPDKIIPLREVCKLICVKPNTVREWAKSGKISYVKTPTGQTLYPKSQFKNLISSVFPIKEKEKIIYCRVSSSKQLDDLQRQVDLLKLQYPEHKLITDCASGINWKRHGLKSILESSMQGNIKEVVVAHKDRLSRFGFELLEWIISRNGGKIIVLDEDNTKSSEQELAEDLLSIVHIYSCRAMGKRRYNNKINKDKIVSNKRTEDNIKKMDGDM